MLILVLSLKKISQSDTTIIYNGYCILTRNKGLSGVRYVDFSSNLQSHPARRPYDLLHFTGDDFEAQRG